MHGEEVADDLALFAEGFSPPRGGRYSDQPAVADRRGIVSVPPPVPDPLPGQLLTAGLAAGGAWLALRRGRLRR